MNETIKTKLSSYYRYEGKYSQQWMKDDNVLLSPRSCAVKNRTWLKKCRSKNSGLGDSIEYLVCSSCKCAVERKQISMKGINNFLLGGLPAKFDDVTDVEFAYVSLVRTHCHLISYQGGPNKKMKGYHTFMKLDIQKLSNSTRLIEQLTDTENIKVVLTGPFTKKQKERAYKRSEINLKRIMELLYWLKSNNHYYSSLTNEDINNLPIPKIEIIDKSIDQDSENENVELTEDFKVVFPEGTTTENNGGLDSMKDFVDVIKKVRDNGTNMEIMSKSLPDIAPDYKDNNLVKAFPKVFPYGYGGPHDDRYMPNASLSKSWKLQDYLEHISMLSKPSIHEGLFSLVVYNIYTKQTLVKNAVYRSRDDMNLTENFANLKAKDVIEAAENRDLGLSAEFKTEVRFMRLIETISKSLPHSDGAAKKARGNIEALNHKFGDCTHFLTVTPDEENGIEIQAYSSVDIDISDTKKISEMSKEELQKKGILRKKISWQYPGFSAFYFLQVLDIINEVIVGWNFYEGRAFESGGYFGIPQAAMNSKQKNLNS